MINAFNHVLCALSSNDLLNKFERPWYTYFVCQFVKEERVPFAGPWDLFALKVFSFFHTRSGVMVIFENISPLNSSIGSGITIFSTVNMLLKYLFSAFALSSGNTAFVPSGLSSAGMEALVFNLDFAYFQYDLGFSFTLRAKFVSKSLLAILVVRRSLFLHLIYFFLCQRDF